MEHPCAPHYVGTPLENSGTPLGVRYVWMRNAVLHDHVP